MFKTLSMYTSQLICIVMYLIDFVQNYCYLFLSHAVLSN